MKILTLIVHTEVQQALTDLLRSRDFVSGFTFTHVEGHGIEVETDRYLEAHDEAMGFVPRIRTDLLIEEENVDAVIDAVKSSIQAVQGRAVFWVTPAEAGGHL